MGVVSSPGAFAPPLYFPTSVAAGVGGDVHIQAPYNHGLGASLHPLQRSGQVGFESVAAMRQAGAGGPRGLDDPVYPAAYVPMTLPPVVPIAGGPRDPSVMV